MAKSTNRIYTIVQGAADGKHGISLHLHSVLQSAVHQNPASAADPADHTLHRKQEGRQVYCFTLLFPVQEYLFLHYQGFGTVGTTVS